MAASSPWCLSGAYFEAELVEVQQGFYRVRFENGSAERWAAVTELIDHTTKLDQLRTGQVVALPYGGGGGSPRRYELGTLVSDVEKDGTVWSVQHEESRRIQSVKKAELRAPIGWEPMLGRGPVLTVVRDALNPHRHSLSCA